MANITVRNNPYSPAFAERDPFRMMERDPFRMMREMLNNWDPFMGMSQGFEGRTYMPAFDVRETKDSYVFKADMPGLKEADLDVTYQGNQLVVRGKREMEKDDKNDTYHTYERSYGTFSRAFTLPIGVDAEHASAELKEGILTIAIPKSAESQPKKINLSAPRAKG